MAFFHQRIFLWCSILVLCFSMPSFAQNSSEIKISTDSLVNIGREKLISLSIRIDNNSDQDFEGHIMPVLPKGFGLVADQPIKVKVQKKAHTFYPFKFLVLNNADAKTNQMVFQLHDLNNALRAEVKTSISMLPLRATELIVLTPSILLKQIGDSLTVNLLIRNAGNQVEELKLIASFPSDNGQGKNVLQKDIKLSPGMEQQISFGKIINRELYQLNNFYVNIAGIYKNGELFGNGIAYVQNAAANRQFVSAEMPQNILNRNLTNQISLSSQNLFSDSQSWQLNGTGATQLGHGILGFSVDAYQWNSLANRPLISNTWLNYEGDKKGITVGNISENLESFINGRGVKIYTRADEDRHGVEAAFVQKSYNLLGDNLNYGYSAYLKAIVKDTSGHELSSSFIFDYAPLEQSRSILSANTVSLLNKRNLVMSVNIGGGLSQDLLNPDDIKPSFALGTNFSGNWQKLNFSSNNFFSTAYYPGIRRGVLQLNERISRYFGKHNAWLGFSLYNFDPAYQRNIFLFQRNYSLQRMEAGWAIPVKVNLNLTLTASRDQEKSDYNFLQTETNKLTAYRLNESINWHSSDFRQNIFFSMDNGFGQNMNGKTELQLRLNATWSNSWMNLNAYLQKGSFLLAESYNTGLKEQEIYRFSISPSFHQYFFNKKLRAEAGLIFYRDAFFGNNITYTGKADYKITPKTAFYISSYAYQYRTSFANSSFRSLQAGITQKLPDPRQHIPGKKGNIAILIYKDNNQNGIFDAGDEPANSGTLLVNKIIFIIPANGTIQYSKVPYGDYSLNMPLQNGYQIMPMHITIDQKNIKINVPMQKSGNVTGRIAINFNETRSLQIDPSLAGINILIKGKDGMIRAVKTGEDGDYSVYLPEGDYQAYPDVMHLPEHVYFDGEPTLFTVKSAIATIIPTITLKVKEKKIEIKRFKN